MRFAHRQAARDAGGVSPGNGGLFSNSPVNSPGENNVEKQWPGRPKGELGDFSSSLYARGEFHFPILENNLKSIEALAKPTPTPPAPAISPAKPLREGAFPAGGVFTQTPPVTRLTQNAAMSDLPAEIMNGLRALRADPAPKITHPPVWAEIVDDAMMLAADGWAATALGLGWTVVDLYGVGPRDSHEFAGLAVWLGGHRILALNKSGAVVRTSEGHDYFTRGGWGHGRGVDRSPVLLWEFGKQNGPSGEIYSRKV